jgi:hypothetical protein
MIQPHDAKRFGVTPPTIYKGRKPDTVEDRSHAPHRRQTALTPAHEAVAAALRKTLLVWLDDLLALVREFLNLAQFSPNTPWQTSSAMASDAVSPGLSIP